VQTQVSFLDILLHFSKLTCNSYFLHHETYTVALTEISLDLLNVLISFDGSVTLLGLQTTSLLGSLSLAALACFHACWLFNNVLFPWTAHLH